MITELDQQVDQFRRQFSSIKQQVGRRIVGNDEVIEGTLTALLAGGHVLLEGIPGLGKTQLVHTIPMSFTCSSRASSSRPI